ncbi:MAG: gamma carbonic anhydrase family protein [Candidatus Sedimenticola endophacoides]
MSNVRPFDGMQPKIAEEAWVDPSAVVIGDVEIGPGASIWPLTVVRGDIHRIRIGAGSNIQDGSVVHVTHDSRFNPGGFPVCIGERVTVGHKVMLHGCTIGDHCLIGMGAIVMDGARIGARVILAAGSLVPPGKHLPGGYLYRGSPARQVRPLGEEELAFLEYVSGNYVELARRYRRQESPPAAG